MTRATVVVLILTGLCCAGPFGSVPAARAAASQPAVGDTVLLPPDPFNGWKKAEAPRVFTQADLYGYIDGGAELFFEFGFEQMTLQRYRNGSGEITVETYRMTDPVAATGIYLMKCGKESRDASFRERHTIGRYQLQFERHRYYVIITSKSGSEQFKPELVKFATFVAGKLPADVGLPALRPRPAPGLVASSLRLFRGPLGLQSAFTLGDGDVLMLGGKLTAVAAEYDDPALGRYTAILVEYATPTAAARALAHLQSNLDRYLKPIDKSPTRLVFRDFENKFGEVTVSGRRLEVKVHLQKQP